MAKYCPVTNSRVVYLVCQECDDRVCEQKKYEPKEKKCECVCETCFNKDGEYEQVLFGQKRTITKCKIFHNELINALKIKTECDYHNVDVSQMKICLNCEHYLGGGDWGLSCGKEYHKLVDPVTEACFDFLEKRK